MRLIPSLFFTMVIIVALGAQSAFAACAPGSTQALVTTLQQQSPYEGEWKLRGHDGPVTASFNEVAGVAYVSWRSSGTDGRLGPARDYVLMPVSATELAFNTGDSRHRLTLNSDCNLKGTQAHRNGAVEIEMAATGRGVARPRNNPANFSSTTELAHFLTQGSPFNGEWSWGPKSGPGRIVFTTNGGLLRVTDKGDTAAVTLLSPTQLRYTLPGDRGTVQLEAQTGGVLRGVQASKGHFAVQIEMTTSSQQFVGN